MNEKFAMPKVSVIIPTYNCAKYLPEAIESVLAQTFRDFEIVIVDDGSCDETHGLVSGYLARHAGKIKYIYQINQGMSSARNAGIARAAGEYVALLDSDDLWTSDRLELEVDILNKRSGVGVVHANIAWMSENGMDRIPAKREPCHLSGRIFTKVFLRTANISTATLLIRKECFSTVGLFDENLNRLGAEDREMCLRLAQKYNFFYLDRVLAYYRIRDNSFSKNCDKMLRGRYYIVDKFTKDKKNLSLLRNMALARIHREIADSNFLKQKFSQANREYMKSLFLWPFFLRSWLNFLKSCLRLRVDATKWGM